MLIVKEHFCLSIPEVEEGKWVHAAPFGYVYSVTTKPETMFDLSVLLFPIHLA